MNNRLPLVVLISILLGYTAHARAVSEDIKKRVENDLHGYCLDLFLTESRPYGIPTGYQTIRVRTAFALGQVNSSQYCAWHWTGLLTDWANAEVPALAECNRDRPQGSPPCEIYARGNDIVYVSVQEKLKTAKRLIDAGDIANGRSSLEEVASKSLAKLTTSERGEYEYLWGKVFARSEQDNDRAITQFHESWFTYGHVDGALDEASLRILAGNIATNWESIRSAYQYFLEKAPTEKKARHPEAEPNLKQTEPYYLADLARKEETAKEQALLREQEAEREAKRKVLLEVERIEQARLSAIAVERYAKHLSALEKERLEQEKIDAPRKKREAEQLARQQKLDALKAEREAKKLAEQQKREAEQLARQQRLDALKADGDAKKLAEQQRLDALKAEREAKQQEKIRLAEEKRLAATGDGSADDKTCKSYGAKPGSQGYITCRVQLAQAKQAADAQQAGQAQAAREQQAAQKAVSEAAAKVLIEDFNRNRKCAEETRDPGCFNNAGLAAAKLGDIEVAKKWFTVAARYGAPVAISNLKILGAPVPAPDLLNKQQMQAKASSDDQLGDLFSAIMGSQISNMTRPKPPPPRALQCSGMALGGGLISGTCR